MVLMMRAPRCSARRQILMKIGMQHFTLNLLPF